MSRKNAREDAFRLIFSQISNPRSAETLFEEYTENKDLFTNRQTVNDNDYVLKMLSGVSVSFDAINEKIEQNLTGWDIDRISNVSMAILKLSLFEILYCDDIPVGVSINEAVELAKKYGGEEESSFVNGILGKISKE